VKPGEMTKRRRKASIAVLGLVALALAAGGTAAGAGFLLRVGPAPVTAPQFTLSEGGYEMGLAVDGATTGTLSDSGYTLAVTVEPGMPELKRVEAGYSVALRIGDATIAGEFQEGGYSLTLGRPLGPDLAISEKHEEWEVEGETYTVHYTVANTGTSDVPAGHDVELLVDGVSVEQLPVPVALAPGESHSGSFTTIIQFSGTSDDVEVCADVNGEITESDETNNCQSNYWPLRELVSIAVTPVDPTIPFGPTQQFTATGTYTDGSTEDITSSVTWSSSDTGVATIDAAGLATAVGEGTTTITATMDDIRGNTTLTVGSVPLVAIEVTPVGPSIALGHTQQFTATATYGDGSTADITASVTWTSSDSGVATINDYGLATAVGEGTTTIAGAVGAISDNTTLTVTVGGPALDIDVVLVDGWNIIALAANPAAPYTASTLAADINSQGGGVSQVFWWNASAGGWDFWLVDVQYGTDFVIEVGYGYLLRNTVTATWSYTGTRMTAAYAATVQPRITNVTDKAFTVSWVSQETEEGYVRYGAAPDTLDQTAYDERGAGITDDTHHVTVSDLAADTPCYFEVISGGTTHDDGGVPLEAITGPTLASVIPEDLATGTVYQSDGTTPAEGTIVYVRIGTASSQWLSALTNASGTWGVDVTSVRTEDLQDYYSYTDADEMVTEAQGAADGIDSQVVTVATAKAGASAMAVSLTVEISLVDGWNLIALPIEPAIGFTANTMAADINAHGGSVSQVFWWNASAGGWDFWLVDEEYGTDFAVELGEGYLLRNGTGITWAVHDD